MYGTAPRAPIPTPQERQREREREREQECKRWSGCPFHRQSGDHSLCWFAEEVDKSFGCTRVPPDEERVLSPFLPKRAYTKGSFSTSDSNIQLLHLDAEPAIAAAIEGSKADDGADWKPERKQWLVMISLSLVSFVVSLDATILVTALPDISRSLRGTAAETFWTGTSYLLTSAVCQPVIAAASSCFGRQRLLVTSIVLFTFGTAFCAVAHDFAVMLIGRCVQGVGGGGIIATTQVIFCDMVPLRQRPQYFSIVLASWSIGSIVGPVVGGSLVERASWRWCFHINYPFCFAGLVAALLFVRPDADEPKLPLAQRLRRMDWVGALLFMGSMTGLLVGVSWGGTQHAWASAATLGPIIAGALGIVAFVGWQRHAQPYSLLPMSLLRNASSIAAFYCALANGLILFTGLYYVPFYQMSLRGSSPIRAGVDLFPAVCLLVPGSVIVAVLTSRLGRFRWAVWLGWSVTLVACGLFTLLDERTEKAVFALALAVFGVGNGMVLTSVNVATQAVANQTVAKKEDRAMAACMYGFMRSLGMPIGVALSGTVFQNAMGAALSDAGLSADIARDSERYIFVLRGMADADPSKAALLASYTTGFHAVFVAMTAVSATALLAAFAIRKFSMDTVHAPASQQHPSGGDDWARHGPERNARRVCARGADRRKV